ncbi:MAG: hypothetical protein RL076_2509 [Chloroflexota bacterium]|jgi:hypothetical protein
MSVAYRLRLLRMRMQCVRFIRIDDVVNEGWASCLPLVYRCVLHLCFSPHVRCVEKKLICY